MPKMLSAFTNLLDYDVGSLSGSTIDRGPNDVQAFKH